MRISREEAEYNEACTPPDPPPPPRPFGPDYPMAEHLLGTQAAEELAHHWETK